MSLWEIIALVLISFICCCYDWVVYNHIQQELVEIIKNTYKQY